MFGWGIKMSVSGETLRMFLSARPWSLRAALTFAGIAVAGLYPVIDRDVTSTHRTVLGKTERSSQSEELRSSRSKGFEQIKAEMAARSDTDISMRTAILIANLYESGLLNSKNGTLSRSKEAYSTRLSIPVPTNGNDLMVAGLRAHIGIGDELEEMIVPSEKLSTETLALRSDPKRDMKPRENASIKKIAAVSELNQSKRTGTRITVSDLTYIEIFDERGISLFAGLVRPAKPLTLRLLPKRLRIESKRPHITRVEKIS